MLKPVVAFLVASIAAQTSPPPQSTSSDEIVVQAVRPSEHQVRDFVRNLTAVPSYGQIGRFHHPICPVAMGLRGVQNGRIAERMRQVAAAAAIPVGPAGCTPNVFVIVAPDKAAAITELNRRFPAYFSQMSARHVRELTASPEPAAAWQLRGLLTQDGEEAAKAVGADYYTIKGTQSPSRIKAVSKPTFTASVVVIDVKAAAGLTLVQLADYAAMRTFADIEPARITTVGVPTILTVLGQPDDKPLPVTLTYWDLGFLKSLYATDNSYLASYQRGDMEQLVKQEVEQSGAAPKR
jgi:hypothetical protein